MTGNVLCRCGDEQRAHLRQRIGWTVCQRNGCHCVRFTEAEFTRQQLALFEDVKR